MQRAAVSGYFTEFQPFAYVIVRKGVLLVVAAYYSRIVQGGGPLNKDVQAASNAAIQVSVTVLGWQHQTNG